MNQKARETSANLVALIQVIFFGIACLEVWQGDMMSLFIVLQAMAVTAVPYFLERRFNVYIPHQLQVGIAVFMFATLILGSIADFYITFGWWDAALHAIAGFGLTLIGFVFLVKYFKATDLASTTFLTSFLAFSFSICLAVLWEVYEFVADYLFPVGMPMQRSNIDTMSDLLFAIAGGLVACIGGYRYLNKQDSGIIGEVIEDGNNHI